MGIPTTNPAPERKTKTNPLPMQGEMKEKLDSALNDLKDVYGGEEDESGEEQQEYQSDENETGVKETGIKLHPMPEMQS